jgi:hypothetical protein
MLRGRQVAPGILGEVKLDTQLNIAPIHEA